jgi:hypothetical protein
MQRLPLLDWHMIINHCNVLKSPGVAHNGPTVYMYPDLI